MDVRGILRDKGGEVTTIEPTATVREAISLLTERRIGAVVVSSTGQDIEGILSERDIVRELDGRGSTLFGEEVRVICTDQVRTCTPDTDVDELMSVMTTGRFRHVPVVDEHDHLIGVVSIGDVVKHRVAELEGLTRDLESYVSGTW